MRILIAGHTNLPFGGIASYCESLLNSSLRDYLEIYFVETSCGGIEVSSRGNWGIRTGANAIRNIIGFVLSFLRVRPHVVHIMTAPMPSMLKHGLMCIIAKVLGSKTILHIHCGVTAMFPKNGGFLNIISKFIIKNAHGILVLSKEWISAKEFLGNISMKYLPNGIILTPYLAISRQVNIMISKPLRVLLFGHLGEAKGTFDLIEAAKLLRKSDFIFDLVGESFSKKELKDINTLIEKCGLTSVINISPPEFGTKKIERLSHADIFILPSHSEGMPVSIIESMASGLPVIATNVGGIPEMIENGKTGFLVPSGNPELLADAINNMKKNSEDRIRMGITAREVAKYKYDIELIVPQLVEYYHFVGNPP